MAHQFNTHTEASPVGAAIVSCPACFGEGTTDYATCVLCAGEGSAIKVGNHIAWLPTDLSAAKFHRERIANSWRILIRGSVFCGAIAALVYAALTFEAGITEAILSDFVSALLIFAATGDSFLFWVGVLCALFVYVSIERDSYGIKKIPRLAYAAPSTHKTVRLDVYSTVTGDARSYIAAAMIRADRLRRPYRPADLFLSLINSPEVALMLLRLGVQPADAGRAVVEELRAAPSVIETTIGQTVLRAYLSAYYDRRERLDCSALFEATIALDATVRDVLYERGITESKIRHVLLWQQNDRQLRQRYQKLRMAARLRPHSRLDRAMTAVATPLLDAFSEDITEQAQYGGTFPFVRRQEAMKTALRIFESGGMPLLVGEQGVGKRGLLEDLADRMMSGEVPETLKDKRLVNLVLPKLVSGANPSEAAQRILRVLNEASRSGNIVLAISGVHGVRGISSGQAGSVDLAEVLATGVRRLRIKVIATTTPEAHRQYLVGSALGGLFESVLLTEPTVEEAIPMVESHALLTELSHGVFFTYDAIERLVDLTSRFLPDKRLPKKAIDLLDELALFMRETRQKAKVIGAGDVDSFLSSKIDIPLRDVSHDESSLLLNFEDRIHERLINQEQAVSVVADALRRARAEIRDTKRPIVNLLFLGPTGVGKTELAKTVAALYFGDEKRMVRIDMSEYVGAESVERLTGGRTATYGILTEAVRAHPFSLVLLDELEKADTRVLNLFLQILDDGRVTAGNGEVIDFTNTIIIATSNAGTEYIQDAVRRGDNMPEIEKTLHETVLRKNFAPEFINRFDAVVVFKPLTLPHVEAIASLLLAKVAKRMEAHGVSFVALPAAVEELAAAGFDPLFGARPLRRVIQDRVDSVLARYLLEGRLHRRDSVTLEPGGILRIARPE